MKTLSFIPVMLWILSSCGGKPTQEEPGQAAETGNSVVLTEAQARNAGIVTGSIERRDIASVLKVNGKIDVPPQNLVSVSVPMGGYLKTTRLLPGMHVKKGEVIAAVEDQQYVQMQQEYLTAKARIGFLENEYLRQKELNESKSASDKVYQQAESDYKREKIVIASLAEKLRMAGINTDRLNESTLSGSIYIHSPINGYVSKVNVNTGKYVSPTEVLFELINPEDIHLALKVYEKDLGKLFIGQALTAYTNNQPEKKYRCEILLVGKDLSADGNTEVHCHFEEYDKTLFPGTYMNAEIRIKNKNALVLPEEAIVNFENKHFIFIQKAANEYEMTELQTGMSADGWVEVLSGEKIKPGEVVLKGAYTLLMSLKNKEEE